MPKTILTLNARGGGTCLKGAKLVGEVGVGGGGGGGGGQGELSINSTRTLQQVFDFQRKYIFLRGGGGGAARKQAG